MAGRARDLPIWHNYFFHSLLWGLADILISFEECCMWAIIMLVMSGYGCGYEGYENGKLRVGLYTPNAEYGYVISDKEIYLDTVLEKG